MSMIADSAMDAGLNVIKGATQLLLCSSEPADRAAAIAAQLAHKDTPSLSDNEDGTTGRQFRVLAITDATGDADGSASSWALISGTLLLAAGTLAAEKSIASGSTVSVTEFPVRLGDPS